MPRPNIAYFEYHDVFEDFYPKYGVSQQMLAETWTGSFTYSLLTLVQREFGDVVWYAFSLAPEPTASRHRGAGCRVRMMRSSLLHRAMWRCFYLPRAAWRWRRFYRWYAAPASYVATLSWPFMRALLRERPDALLVQDYANGRFDLTRATGAIPARPTQCVAFGQQSGTVSVPVGEAVDESESGLAARVERRGAPSPHFVLSR